MNTLIYDEQHLKDFISILPELGIADVYFVSLSCRNKYLTDEEKQVYNLGRTEMFGQAVARSKEKLYRQIRRYETHPEAFITKNGSNIPSKALVCYLNIDTSSSLKAYYEFESKMKDNIFDLVQKSTLGQNPEQSLVAINKLDKILMDSYQVSKSIKKFIDIDFDIPKDRFDLVQILLDDLNENKVDAYIIDTKSGYHVLIERANLKYNYTKSIDKCNEVAKKDLEKFEIMVNKNAMVPIPGTLQAEHKVKFFKVIRK